METATADQTRATLPGVCPPVAPHEDVKDCTTLMDFIIMETLGEGTFGKVVKAKIRASPSEFVAIKVMNKDRLDSLGSLKYARQELEVHKNLQHPNIVEVLGVREDSRNLYLILKWVQGLELFEIIQRRGHIAEDEAKPIFAQLMCAVDFLHSHGIAHRDIKLENVLVDDKGTVKLIDFGLSRFYRRGDALATCCGADVFAAPEMYTGVGYDPAACDVWSCGVVLWALLTGFMPFRRWQPVSHFLHMIRSGSAPAVQAVLSAEVRQMFALMFAQPHQKRISTRQLRMHPWLGSFALSHAFADPLCPSNSNACVHCASLVGVCVHTSSLNPNIKNVILPTNKKLFAPIPPVNFYLGNSNNMYEAHTPTTSASPLSRFGIPPYSGRASQCETGGDSSPSVFSLSPIHNININNNNNAVSFDNAILPPSAFKFNSSNASPYTAQGRLTVSTVASLSSPEMQHSSYPPPANRPSLKSHSSILGDHTGNNAQLLLPGSSSSASSNNLNNSNSGMNVSTSSSTKTSSVQQQQEQQLFQQQQQYVHRPSVQIHPHHFQQFSSGQPQLSPQQQHYQNLSSGLQTNAGVVTTTSRAPSLSLSSSGAVSPTSATPMSSLSSFSSQAQQHQYVHNASSIMQQHNNFNNFHSNGVVVAPTVGHSRAQGSSSSSIVAAAAIALQNQITPPHNNKM